MPKGNRFGNRKMKYTKLGGMQTISSKVDSSLASLMGASGARARKMHDARKKGDQYRIRRAILVHCYHYHQGKSISEVCKRYDMSTDEVRRSLHTTKRMFDNWKLLED